ncbi:MAG: polysaccharide deacetylase family protein [Polyangiales bacterium]
MSAQNYCLHYVSEGQSSRRLAISQDELRHLVQTERDAGRRALSLADADDASLNDDAHFSLSFDDAHRSVLDYAAPVLQELDVAATLFVPTAYVGTSPEFLTWDELRALRDLGWTLGSHSVSHVRLGQRIYDEGQDAHARRLREECERSRDAIRRALGETPLTFAYPYGEVTPLARAAVQDAGYASAFSVAAKLAWDGDMLAVPRVAGEGYARASSLSASDDSAAPVSISVVVPAYNRAHILSEVVTRLASQSYPEERYEVIVVDDGSDDDLSPIFEEMPENVRCIRHGDTNFRAGQARQLGADHAKHEVLAFLDADIIVGEDYLWHLDWIHRNTPDAVILGYLSGYNLHAMGHIHSIESMRGANLDEVAIIPDRSREPVLRTCLDNVDWLKDPWRLCYTGNVSFPKALLERIGGFAKGFVGWGLEDVDLGYRLHEAGASYVFSRYALGYHVEDEQESSPNNPFRRDKPEASDFEGYLRNLSMLGERHDGEVMREYVRQNILDVEETCSRPYTVGIEFGGSATREGPCHSLLHRRVVGGVPEHELLDRIAYARKVGAKSVYLLGGAPAEHPAFLRVVKSAKDAGLWVAMRSLVYPFADTALADAARHAGLDSVTCEVHSLGGEGDAQVQSGLDALLAAGVECRARIIVSPSTADIFRQTLEAFETKGVGVDEVEITDPALTERIRALSPVSVGPAGP